MSAAGVVHYFESSRFPVLDSHGLPYAVGNVSVDVTTEVRAREDLLKSENRYRAIVDDQAVFVARHRADGVLSYVNGPFIEQFKSVGGVLGQPFESIVATIDRSRVEQAIREITPQHPISQYEHRVSSSSSTESPRWIKWIHRGIFDERGRVSEYQAVGFDVSESRYKTDQLLERDSVYSSVFDHTIDFLSVYRVRKRRILSRVFQPNDRAVVGSFERADGRSKPSRAPVARRRRCCSRKISSLRADS